MIQVYTVTPSSSDQLFNHELNSMLSEIQNKGHKIVDIKFNSNLTTGWTKPLFTAIIIYKLKTKQDEEDNKSNADNTDMLYYS